MNAVVIGFFSILHSFLVASCRELCRHNCYALDEYFLAKTYRMLNCRIHAVTASERFIQSIETLILIAFRYLK